MATLILIKRGHSWQYRFEVSKVQGKRKQITKSGFKTKKEARAAGLKALDEYLNLGTVYKSENISLADYLDLWYKAYCLVQSRFNTQRVHGNSIERHIKPILGRFALSDINTYLIQEFVNALKLSGLAKQTVKNTYSTLNLALGYAVHTLKLLKSNPCNGVQLPKFEDIKKESRYVISLTNFKKILDKYPPGSPEYLPLVIGFHTGMRISEVFALTWDDINFQTNQIKVRRIIERRNYNNKGLKQLTLAMEGNTISGWFFGPTKTKNSVRTISMGPTLAQVLTEELKRQEEAKNWFKKEYIRLYKKPERDEKGNTIYKLISAASALPAFYREVNLICRRNNGHYYPFTSLSYPIRLINKELGIPFNFHSLRHTHATMLIQGGANIKAIQQRLGHSKASITLDTYSHLTQRMIDTSIEILEQQLHIND